MFRPFALAAMALALSAARPALAGDVMMVQLQPAASTVAAAAPASQRLSDGEARQVQAVVDAQLKAFAADDAEAAFATATPQVRESLGSADRFLEMVRGLYPMVYRHRAANFQKAELDAGRVVQVVEVRDEADKTWMVLFALERQPDQSWRIRACGVAENSWKPA